ncbi:FAD-dependent oxidoreductase [Shewanella sp. Scap07]|uniref:glycerol-3-phosphate dehydrogenase/oxidase n=1 Tax=Shewanella sp. Scap07 TaxID=2589987 RepID=UPI0015B7DA48|nr:FAD-dependent oxidoreductase [Shewanella sp. Scap07]QLE84287.1 FAD-dependent oxidoreductase [Shewanella sp. Scap07]
MLDIVVIGGGINGAGIAQAAQAAGYRTLLLERGEFGGQTSRNSSKLIHGGLRYLESGQIDLVRQSLRERQSLLKLAPSLVKPVKFYIPIYQHSRRGALTIAAGLSAYALLSELNPLGRFTTVARPKWPKLSGLKQSGLNRVFQYWDAQTDDKALTQAVINSAQSLGTRVLSQAEVLSIEHLADGCSLQYQHQGQRQQVRSQMIVNAAGPWVTELLSRVTPPLKPPPLSLVQGSHLVLDIAAPAGVFYIESIFDERVIFVMPWHGKTLVGTTETPIASIEQKGMTAAEQQYLLANYRHYFAANMSEQQLVEKVSGQFCGVRVLPAFDSQAFSQSRETLLHIKPSHPRLLSVYGGKLTTYKHTAQQTLQQLSMVLGPRQTIADVEQLILR